ncbi:MAG: hypothetical protein JWO09_2255 [Bacteroidetes bacterium]|nr:hypothetical protein [Bacteroidota bacterium]
MRKKSVLILVIAFLQFNGQAQDSLREFRNRFDVLPLELNSAFSEISPFVAGKTLYFSANRRQPGAITYSTPSQEGNFYDVFSAEKIDSIHFSKPAVSKKWSSLFNDGPLCINEQGNAALITSNQKDYGFVIKDPKEQQQLKLFYASSGGREWSQPQLLPFCKGPYSYCHGTFAGNGDAIIFASDQPGGFGGMDLYISERVNNEWSTPRNLGNKINSASNELFPFVCKNGELYFSSDRPGGAGGLDVYSMVMKDSLTAQVKPLEDPLNSASDDFGIWVDGEGASGYLSSNRNEGKQDDLFYFYKILPDFEKEIKPKTRFCYTFFEEASAAALDTSGLEYEWDFGNGKKLKGLEVQHCFDKPGTYPVQLNIVDRSSGELFMNDVSYDFVVEEPKQINIICPDTVAAGSPTAMDASTSLIAGYTIKKYYWTFDDGWYSLGMRARHKYLNTGLHKLKLGVLAVEDASGKEATFYSEKTILVVK